jgi:hypothetical protein
MVKSATGLKLYAHLWPGIAVFFSNTSTLLQEPSPKHIAAKAPQKNLNE